MIFRRSSRQRQPAVIMTLEGVLGPNSRLEEAPGLPVSMPDALCVAADGNLLFSSGANVYGLQSWGAEPFLWRTFDRTVTFLCSEPSGLVAIGIEGGGLEVCDCAAVQVPGWPRDAGGTALTDGVFLSPDELAVLDSGYPSIEDALTQAPWEEAARGKAMVLSCAGGARTMAQSLHAPLGICCDSAGEIIITEMERGRIVDIRGKPRQSGYPAYAGRIRATATGFAMACLARRDPLIEFLKSERQFVAEMKDRIAHRHWISPRMNPEFSHDFPIELGATRLFGEVKPWAPSFSYGLVIELDADLMPVGSAHSRANGRRHAISDVTHWRGHLLAVSKASGEILNLGPEGVLP